MENKPWQLPGGVGKSGGIDPLVEDLASRTTITPLMSIIAAPYKLHTVQGRETPLSRSHGRPMVTVSQSGAGVIGVTRKSAGMK